MKLQQSNKGVGLYMAAFFVLLMVLTVFFFVPEPLTQDKPVGQHQYEVLGAGQEQQASLSYIKQSTQLSAQYATHRLFTTAGLYRLPQQNGQLAPTACGSHVYPLYTSKQASCTPNFFTSFNSYYKESFDSFISSYQSNPLLFDYALDISSHDAKTTISLRSSDRLLQKIHSLDDSSQTLLSRPVQTTQQNDLKKGLLGGLGDERIISCATGMCFADVAHYFYEFYRSQGKQFSYVLNGESPYTYKQTIQAQQEQGRDSFFYGVSVEELQPTGAYTKPGFDGAGWLWWVGKHAGISGLETRLSAAQYYQNAVQQALSVCDIFQGVPCNDSSFSQIQPGDVLFYAQDNQNVHHVALALDNQQLIHSGPRGLREEPLHINKEFLVAIYRFPYDIDGLVRLDELTSSPLLQVIPTTQRGSFNVLAYGDSITADGGYISQLEQLGVKEITNKGTVGYTTKQLLTNYASTLSQKPYTDIIIFAGINDLYAGYSVSQIQENLQKLYTQAHNGGLRVIAVTITPSKGYARWDATLASYREMINNWMRNEAQHVDIVVDMASHVADSQDKNLFQPQLVSADKLHPNTQGQALIGKKLYQEAFSAQAITGECNIAINPAFYNEQAQQYTVSMELITKQIQASTQITQAIQQAHNRFPRIPIPVIKAFIAVETGNSLDAYISYDEVCNSVGSCGLMQVQKDTCKTVDSVCDFSVLQKGDHDMAVLSGTAVLDFLLEHYNDPSNPDYYFLALAYNAGQGSMQKIKQAVSTRKKIAIDKITWGDVSLEDVETGMKNYAGGCKGQCDGYRGDQPGCHWACSADKWGEIYSYPNIVASAILQQCGVSTTTAGLIKNDQPYTRELQTVVNSQTNVSLDLDALGLIETFVSEIKQKCGASQSSCVKNYIASFNQRYKGDITITTGKEDFSQAYDMAQQLYDCLAVNATNCICPIDDSSASLQEPLAYELTNKGSFTQGSIVNVAGVPLRFFYNQTITNLPFTPTNNFHDVTLQAKKLTIFQKQASNRPTLYFSGGANSASVTPQSNEKIGLIKLTPLFASQLFPQQKQTPLSLVMPWTQTPSSTSTLNTYAEPQQKLNFAQRAEYFGSKMVLEPYYQVGNGGPRGYWNNKNYVKAGEQVPASYPQPTWCNAFAMDLARQVFAHTTNPFEAVEKTYNAKDVLVKNILKVVQSRSDLFTPLAHLNDSFTEANKGKAVYLITPDHIATVIPTPPSEFREETDADGTTWLNGKVVQAGANVGVMYLSRAWKIDDWNTIKAFVADVAQPQTVTQQQVLQSQQSFTFFGPANACSPTASLSQTYIDRLKQPAWNSAGKSYLEIALEAARKENADPALLITHAIHESSLGANNDCVSYSKSSLTGCGWPGGDCQSGAKQGMEEYVASDLKQFECTAKVDKGAYLEGQTNQAQPLSSGFYKKCFPFKNDPELFLNCFLCIYQGSYDKAIVASGVDASTKPYFTKDKTCEYSQALLDTYCGVVNYLQREDLLLQSSLQANAASQQNNSTSMSQTRTHFLTSSDNYGVADTQDNSYYWARYNESYDDLLCPTPHDYQRFQAHFPFTNKTIDFSLYLPRNTSPSLRIHAPMEIRSSQSPAVLLHFSHSTSISPYRFELFIDKNNTYNKRSQPTYTVLAAQARSLQKAPEKITTYQQLYTKQDNGQQHYYYLISQHHNDAFFLPKQTYAYGVTLVDDAMQISPLYNHSFSISDSTKTVSSLQAEVLGLASIVQTSQTLHKTTLSSSFETLPHTTFQQGLFQSTSSFAQETQSIQSIQQQRIQELITYAQQYVGTGFGGVGPCRVEEAQQGMCSTQPASLLQNIFSYGVASKSYALQGIPLRMCDQQLTQDVHFVNPELLQPGDIFEATGPSPRQATIGHTGIYVGKGTLSKNAFYLTTSGQAVKRDNCFIEFNPDDQGEHVFIHSIGPVCYSTLDMLLEGQGYDISTFCRPQLQKGDVS